MNPRWREAVLNTTWNDVIAWVSAALATVITVLLGGFSPWLSTLLFASFFDWVVNAIVGCQSKNWQASLDAMTIARKLAMLGVLILCHQLDTATAGSGNPGLLQPAATLFYLAHEITNALQGLQALNVPIFPGLTEAATAVLAKSGGRVGDATPIMGAGEVVSVNCDRCRRAIQGIRQDGATAGFYDVTRPPWSKYQRGPFEKVVCDSCMHVDPNYLADFPPLPFK